MYRVTVCAAATLLVALAVVALLVAITVQPSNDDSVCGTGTDDEAISACSRVLALNPKLDEAYTARGNAYYCKGDYDEAVADFDQAIRLDPKNVVAYSIAGVLICINAWPPRVSEARCPEWVTSAVFCDVRDESGLRPAPERSRQRSEPTLRAKKRHATHLLTNRRSNFSVS